jgi:hypothetical protein
MALLDGSAIFGLSTKVIHNPNAVAHQESQFFGVNGTQTLFGGSRGRMFMISGVLVGSSFADIAAAEANLLSFADGNTHILVDNLGRTFQNVIFKGEYQPFDQGPRPLAGGGLALPFRAVLYGLT